MIKSTDVELEYAGRLLADAFVQIIDHDLAHDYEAYALARELLLDAATELRVNPAAVEQVYAEALAGAPALAAALENAPKSYLN